MWRFGVAAAVPTRGPRRGPSRSAVLVALSSAVAFSVAVVGAVVVPIGHTPHAFAEEVVTYRHPVDAPVVDVFRPPPNPYGPGNRGIDYRTEPGSPVLAAADGVVVFAGTVAGGRHVTVLHADGLRTSYSFLASVSVTRGQEVVQGRPLGTAGALLHVGVRDATGAYLDPALLFGVAQPPRVRLVPGVEEGMAPLGEERDALLDLLRHAFGDRLALVAHYAVVLRPEQLAIELAEASVRWHDAQQGCTPASVEPPARSQRRILVLVGGLGSTSENAAVSEVDVVGAGYAPADVVRFSYAGGVVPGGAPAADLASLSARPYTAADSQGDLGESARRLSALLLDVAAAAPGVPIDVVGHSQGGLLSRAALVEMAAFGGPPQEVQTLTTLGTPHEGADLATALSAAEVSRAGRQTVAALAGALGTGIDPTLPASGQLAETSGFMADLRGRPLPTGVQVRSIAARADLVVPVPRTVLKGATSVVVPVDGLRAHDDLPSSAAVTRELALARAGLGPTCQDLGSALGAAAMGASIAHGEDLLGFAALLASNAAGP